MKYKILIIAFICHLCCYANMAQPWVEGSNHSILFSTKNCFVKKESLGIKLLSDEYSYYANYRIKYIIYSNEEASFPILFLGIGLSKNKLVKVNNEVTDIISLDVDNENFPFLRDINSISEVKYAENDSLKVKREDLIYFIAKLNKGENIIYVEYNGDLEYNTFGFLRTYKLQYSLYPSRFWSSFGPIDVSLDLGNNLEIKEINFGNPVIENNIAKWTINKITKDTIEIKISQKTSLLSKILLFIKPLSIGLICFILMFYIHYRLIKYYYVKKGGKLMYLVVLSAGVIFPFLFYVVYFASNNLIDYSLGQKNSKHGYVFFFIFTLPFLMFFYGLIMWLIGKRLKRK